MGKTDKILLEKLRKYKLLLDTRKTKVNPNLSNEEIMLVLQKLNRMPLSLELLEKSGITLTIVKYRKEPDPVGSFVRKLIIKWKTLVCVTEELNGDEEANKQISVLRENSAKKLKNTNKTISFEDFLDSSASAISLQKHTQLKRCKVSASKKIKLGPDPSPSTEPKKTEPEQLPSTSNADCSLNLPDMDLASLLPKPSTEYKPMKYNPLLVEKKSVPKAVLAEQDIATHKVYSKTAVYAGKKSKSSYGVVPSLFDMCLKILSNNIEHVDYVGGIPAFILYPVLEKCSVSQLAEIESKNPHFMGDTEKLWEKFCLREFKNDNPSKDETWKELYNRLSEEKDKKIRELSQRIVKDTDKDKKRLTQRAFMGDVVKTPREVITSLNRQCSIRQPVLEKKTLKTAILASKTGDLKTVKKMVKNNNAIRKDLETQHLQKIHSMVDIAKRQLQNRLKLQQK